MYIFIIQTMWDTILCPNISVFIFKVKLKTWKLGIHLLQCFQRSYQFQYITSNKQQLITNSIYRVGVPSRPAPVCDRGVGVVWDQASRTASAVGPSEVLLSCRVSPEPHPPLPLYLVEIKYLYTRSEHKTTTSVGCVKYWTIFIFLQVGSPATLAD